MNDSVFIETGFKFGDLPAVSYNINRYAKYTCVSPDEQNINNLKEIHTAVFNFLEAYKNYVNWSIDNKVFSVQNLTVGGVLSILVNVDKEDGMEPTIPLQQRVDLLTLQKTYKISSTQHPLLIAAEEFLTAFKDPKLHGYLNAIHSNSRQGYPSEVKITYNGYFISVELSRTVVWLKDVDCTIEVRVVNSNHNSR